MSRKKFGFSEKFRVLRRYLTKIEGKKREKRKDGMDPVWDVPEKGKKNGAGEGSRTLDNHVGNVMLYH